MKLDVLRQELKDAQRAALREFPYDEWPHRQIKEMDIEDIKRSGMYARSQELLDLVCAYNALARAELAELGKRG